MHKMPSFLMFCNRICFFFDVTARNSMAIDSLIKDRHELISKNYGCFVSKTAVSQPFHIFWLVWTISWTTFQSKWTSVVCLRPQCVSSLSSSPHLRFSSANSDPHLTIKLIDSLLICIEGIWYCDQIKLIFYFLLGQIYLNIWLLNLRL